MDHHELDKSQLFLRSYVHEIVDHHEDKEFNYISTFPNLKDDKTSKLDNSRVTVQYPRCSNMVLVLEKALKSENKAFKDFFRPALEAKTSFYDFILGVLIVDSENFKEENKDVRWKNEDLAVASEILKYCRRSVFSSALEQEAYFLNEDKLHFDGLQKNLLDIKYNEEKNIGLGFEALLYKDKKEFKLRNNFRDYDIFLSFHSIPVSLFKLIEKLGQDSVLRTLESLADKSGVDLIVLSCRDNKDSIAAFFIKNNSFFNRKNLRNFFDEIKGKNLKNEGEFLSYADYLWVIRSKNPINRKWLWPDLEEFYKKLPSY